MEEHYGVKPATKAGAGALVPPHFHFCVHTATLVFLCPDRVRVVCLLVSFCRYLFMVDCVCVAGDQTTWMSEYSVSAMVLSGSVLYVADSVNVTACVSSVSSMEKFRFISTTIAD